MLGRMGKGKGEIGGIRVIGMKGRRNGEEERGKEDGEKLDRGNLEGEKRMRYTVEERERE